MARSEALQAGLQREENETWVTFFKIFFDLIFEAIAMSRTPCLRGKALILRVQHPR